MDWNSIAKGIAEKAPLSGSPWAWPSFCVNAACVLVWGGRYQQVLGVSYSSL